MPAVPQRAAKCRRANCHGVQRYASGMCILPSVSSINLLVEVCKSEHFFLTSMTNLRGFCGIVEFLHGGCLTDCKKSGI